MTSDYKTEIEYRSGVVDSLGRCHFTLSWKDNNGKKRGQCFFENPDKYGHKKPQGATREKL
jgi:hypothetical protein